MEREAGRQAGGASGYEDVHEDADVKAPAAGSDGGGGGSGKGWRWCQCGRAGWLIVECEAKHCTIETLNLSLLLRL